MNDVKTVSQALRKIKELKGQLAQATLRMQTSVCWTEPGSKPPYEYKKLERVRYDLVVELVALKARLAKTNTLTNITVGDKTLSLQAAVFVLAEAKARIALLQSLPIREGEEKHLINYDLDRRPIYEMIKTLSALSILERDAAVAEAEKEINELNGIVEDANHRTALVE
jgi:hypothetical protein